jgi:hypothetical protein
MVLGVSDAVIGALAGAAIGAFVGVTGSVLTYRSANRNLIHQDNEAWRKVLIDAAQAFIQAWHELRSLLYPAAEGLRAFDEKARDDLEPLATKCAVTVEVVTLLFGRDSDTGEAADKVDHRIADLKKIVFDTKTKIPWDEAATLKVKLALKAVRDAREEFVQKAHHDLEPKSWRGSGSLTRTRGHKPAV